MYIKVGIDPHDLGVKINKIKVFLSAGHQVLALLSSLPEMRIDPLLLLPLLLLPA